MNYGRKGICRPPVLGVADYTAPTVSSARALPNWKDSGLDASSPYFECWVVDDQSRWWRERRYIKKNIELLDCKSEANRYADQDGINAVLSPYAQLLSPKWNVPGYLDFKNHWGFIESLPAKSWLAEGGSKWIDRAAIVHFIGHRKPWHFGLSGGHFQLQWLQAMKACRFEGAIPTFLTTVLACLGRWKRLLRKTEYSHEYLSEYKFGSANSYPKA